MLKNLKTLRMFLLGLLILPLVMIFNFRVFKDAIKSLFVGLDFVSLNDKNQRRRLTFKQIISTPSLDANLAIEKEVHDLVVENSWLTLSDTINSF